MTQEKNEKTQAEAAISVGQLIYTSFQKFGFSLLHSLETPKSLQTSFIDKVVNARWDPHSPPSSDYRAVYVYRDLGEFPHTVFGWLYYDGQDDFGRSGVPYFLAYHHQGEITPEQLQLVLACLAKGPVQSISREIKDLEALNPILLNGALDYDPVRLGVDIPAEILQKSQQSLLDQTPIDWFISQTSPNGSLEPEIQVYDTPVPEIILPDILDEADDRVLQLVNETVNATSSPPIPSSSPQAADSSPQADESSIDAQQSAEEMQRTAIILEGFVNKTMGLQGIALVSEEGRPIVSAMGLDDDSIEMLAGAMLYTTQISCQELSWPTCDSVTLRGQDNFLLLKAFEPGIFLLIKSAKVPMGLLEGIVKRMVNKLREELGDYDFIAASSDAVHQSSSPEMPDQQRHRPTATEVSDLLKALLKNESVPPHEDDDDDLDDDITYRGRPTSS